MIDLNNKRAVEKLIEGCIKGERNCQKKMYQAFYGKMLAVCARYSRDRDEAQDLLHDGYIKVFTKLNQYEFKGSLEGWVRRIIVNNAIDFIRNKGDYHISSIDEKNYDNIGDDNSTEADYLNITKLKAETIIELIQKLTPAYKTVFNLYVVENYSHKEIAEELNISIGASKSNLAKAKQKIREMYLKNKNRFEREF
ncbi:MAG: RNA polymerase sigma factor [Bacteroidota bacterium]